jgi:hypothetical protein
MDARLRAAARRRPIWAGGLSATASPWTGRVTQRGDATLPLKRGQSHVQLLHHHDEPIRHRRTFPRDEPLRRKLASDAGRVPRLPRTGRSQRCIERELIIMRWKVRRRD